MKIKTDFVTNSSSICFLIFIPPEFKIEENEIIEMINKEQRHLGPPKLPIRNFIKEIPKAIDHLKEGKKIWSEGRWNGQVYIILRQLLEKYDFIFSQFDTSGDGDLLVPLDYNAIMNILLKHTNLSTLVKTFSEEKNVASKDS